MCFEQPPHGSEFKVPVNSLSRLYIGLRQDSLLSAVLQEKFDENRRAKVTATAFRAQSSKSIHGMNLVALAIMFDSVQIYCVYEECVV